MADGTTDAPVPPFREQREMVPVQITNTYDRYCPEAGGQLNAGEKASLPTAEAERAIRLGAAVRLDDHPGPSAGGKASSRSPNKMQEAVATK